MKCKHLKCSDSNFSCCSFFLHYSCWCSCALAVIPSWIQIYRLERYVVVLIPVAFSCYCWCCLCCCCWLSAASIIDWLTGLIWLVVQQHSPTIDVPVLCAMLAATALAATITAAASATFCSFFGKEKIRRLLQISEAKNEICLKT